MSLNDLIPPEIHDDAFARTIEQFARSEKLRTVLEIGSSAGGGSTEAFVRGLRDNPHRPELHCLELSQPRFEALCRRYANEPFVHCHNMSSVPAERFATEAEVGEFLDRVRSPLNSYPRERVLGWLRQDLAYLRDAGTAQDGIRRIRERHGIGAFDAVLIDGSEFTGQAELEEVYGARFLLLDDVTTFKNYDNYNRLLNDPAYVVVAQDFSLRNGFAIFRRAGDLPVHFFTIVLNGMPFIRYHIEMLQRLPFPWTWHIVEGMAELKHDTAWSVPLGGRVTEELHDRGWSNDGTTAYLDELTKRFPDRVIVYRKPRGELCEGKLEMVNAPIENIREDCVLWQIDADELWTPEQIARGRQLFVNNPHRLAAFFWCRYFVGDRLMISTRHTYGNDGPGWRRAWRYSPGYRWLKREPPTLGYPLDKDRWLNVAIVNAFNCDETEAQGLVFEHYAYATEEQARFKEIYYGYRDATERWRRLQEAPRLPARLAEYFPWVRDGTEVERCDALGVSPLAALGPDGQWQFAPLPAPAADPRPRPPARGAVAFPDDARSRIVLDGVFFQIANTGIARVWQALLREWVKTGFAREIIVLDRVYTAPRVDGVTYVNVPRFRYTHVGPDRAGLQGICDQFGARLFVSTYYTTPIAIPSLFVAYDMIPELAHLNHRNPMWRHKRLGVEHARSFVSISESTARDLCRLYPGVAPEAVTVAHCGVDRTVFFVPPPAELDAFRRRYGLDRPYFLLVGTRDRYKNAILFFRAFARFADSARVDVVCTGGAAKIEPYLLEAAPDARVHRLRLNDAELRAAYGGAAALVYPSRHEGFGMPVLEAMACGCPVITCRNSSIPEVAGEAARYVGEDDVEGMVRALSEMQDAAARARWIAAGFERATRFSWERMADIVAQAMIRAARN